MKVVTSIKPYKINSKEREIGDSRVLEVESVWNANKLVRLKFENVNVEVSEAQLLKAISNATGNEFI